MFFYGKAIAKNSCKSRISATGGAVCYNLPCYIVAGENVKYEVPCQFYSSRCNEKVIKAQTKLNGLSQCDSKNCGSYHTLRLFNG